MTTSTTSSRSTSADSPRSRNDYPHIALIGGAGAGKTTLAQHLVDRYAYSRLSFAQPLKDLSCALWGQKRGFERERLQRLGVAVRDIDPDTWVDLLTSDLAEWHSARPVVVDDCRFPNEYQALRELGFVFIKVIADPNDRLLRLRRSGKTTTPAQLMHASEAHWEEFACDHYLYNLQGDVAFTKAHLDDIMHKLAART